MSATSIINIEGRNDSVSRTYRAIAVEQFGIKSKYIVVSVEATAGGNVEGCTVRYRGLMSHSPEIRYGSARTAADLEVERKIAEELGTTSPEPEPTYTCSYCSNDATYVGTGTDGDFYCDEHYARRPGKVDAIAERFSECECGSWVKLHPASPKEAYEAGYDAVAGEYLIGYCHRTHDGEGRRVHYTYPKIVVHRSDAIVAGCNTCGVGECPKWSRDGEACGKWHKGSRLVNLNVTTAAVDAALS